MCAWSAQITATNNNNKHSVAVGLYAGNGKLIVRLMAPDWTRDWIKLTFIRERTECLSLSLTLLFNIHPPQLNIF